MHPPNVVTRYSADTGGISPAVSLLSKKIPHETSLPVSSSLEGGGRVHDVDSAMTGHPAAAATSSAVSRS